MGALKNVVEPLVIVLTFTVGTLIKRRSQRRSVGDAVTEGLRTPPLEGEIALGPAKARPCVPDNSRFRGNKVSRFLNHFPFLIEIWYWLLTYWIYQLARAYSASLIRHDDAAFDVARQHALSILALEESLHIAIEQPLQSWVLTHSRLLMDVLSTIYLSHICLGVMFIVYAYTYYPLTIFQTIRRTIALNNWIAFVIFTSWRCMPPRMLPEEYGFVDILHPRTGPGSAPSWSNNRFQLTIAAMPSLHFGTSLLIGVCLVCFSPHRWLRALAPLWPAAMLVTIMATANHFLLDAVVGAFIPLLGWKLNHVLLVLRPLEEWGFWLCRTEKPRPTEGVAVQKSVGWKDAEWQA